MNSLNELQKVALKIAKEDLGSSFNIEKSIGFLNWIKKKIKYNLILIMNIPDISFPQMLRGEKIDI